MNETMQKLVIKTKRCGYMGIYIQGIIQQESKGTQPIFLTVHDVGKNHNSWLNFVLHPSMNNICEKAVFIHVDLLGQQDDGADLTRLEKFPSMQVMGEDLKDILDHLKIKAAIGLGDGAGANIIIRFMAANPRRCFGAILINCTGTEANLREQFQDRVHSFFPNVQQSAKDYILLHRFGYKLEDTQSDEELAKAVEKYKNHIHELKVNKVDSQLYAESFLSRDDILDQLMGINKNILLIYGTKSPFAHKMDTMCGFCSKAKVTAEKIEGVGDVLEEAQYYLANSVLHFCQDLGWLTKLKRAGIEPNMSDCHQEIPNTLDKKVKSLEPMMSNEPKEPIPQTYEQVLAYWENICNQEIEG